MSLACPSVIAALDPNLCAPVDIYCERTSAALDAEPVNALTNVAFLAAAWLAWRGWSRRPASAPGSLVRVLPAMIAIIGLGSFLFHTVATRWAEWGDVIPILAFIVLYLWFVLSRLLQLSSRSAAVALLLLVVASLYAEALVPARILWGGSIYVPMLIAIVAISLALER